MIITFDNSTCSLSTRIMSSLPSLGLGRQSAGMILMVLERLCQRKWHEKPKKDRCRPSLANAIFYHMSHPWSKSELDSSTDGTLGKEEVGELDHLEAGDSCMSQTAVRETI
mmetsp:Transcript_39667/g.67614  ORF Transcript_39667/g.67614 Transcript_39667/m.67614 type:complete len:111 (-) Transcript_39667:267-599(-)